MKKLSFFLFILSFGALAENSRSPAVLDGSCNLNIPTTITTVVDGKQVTRDKPLEQIQKEQCLEVKKCMNSADELEMRDLKSLAEVACNNNLNAVTTKTPGSSNDQDKDKNDGMRKAKPNAEPTIPDTVKTETDTKAVGR